MITDQQMRVLMKQRRKGRTIAAAAAVAGMGESSGRKYAGGHTMPSQCQVERTWLTKDDPFAEVWEEVRSLLNDEPGLQALTIFEDLGRLYPGKFQDGQLRTLQRKVKRWRALEGPEKEIFFPQKHHPGKLCASDFCHMNSLGVRIDGQPFEHMLYHFVLTYSNWDSGTVCFSESAESLSEGLQNALFELGGVPERHRTDSLTAAVTKPGGKDEFTKSYEELMSHYGLESEHTQPRRPNENGDIEQRHRRMKERLEQALMLRGSREFKDRREYEEFLKVELRRLNRGRSERLKEEQKVLRPLPAKRLDAFAPEEVRVGPGSTIRVRENTYSVHSRLIGEHVKVRIYAETIEVWYAQKMVETLPRLRGKKGHHVNYRHIIDCLVRKVGAFEDYCYRDDLFPTSRFRIAYDMLRAQASKPPKSEAPPSVLSQSSARPAELRESKEGEPSEGGADANIETEHEKCERRRRKKEHRRSDREYLEILQMAAKTSQDRVDDVLRHIIETGETMEAARVAELVKSSMEVPPPTDVKVDALDLTSYDALLNADTLLNSEAPLKTNVQIPVSGIAGEAVCR